MVKSFPWEWLLLSFFMHVYHPNSPVEFEMAMSFVRKMNQLGKGKTLLMYLVEGHIWVEPGMKGVGEMWVCGGRNVRMDDAVKNPEAETQLCV